MIVADHVSREFRTRRDNRIKQGIKDVTFHVPKGEMVGIIGRNGAGKSTLLKMIAGVLAPSSGTIHTLGVDPVKQSRKVASQMTAVFGTTSNLLDDTTVEESLILAGKLYHLPKESYEAQYRILDQVLGLEGILQKKKEELALGEGRRADLAMALLPSPKLVILDEAMVGMDAVFKERTMNYLKQKNKQEQMTVVMATHQLTEISSICSRVLVLKDGRQEYYGSLSFLEQNYAYQATLVISLGEQIPDLEDLSVLGYSVTKEAMVITYDRRIQSAKTILCHILNQCEIKNFSVLEPSLENAFLKENQVGKET